MGKKIGLGIEWFLRNHQKEEEEEEGLRDTKGLILFFFLFGNLVVFSFLISNSQLSMSIHAKNTRVFH